MTETTSTLDEPPLATTMEDAHGRIFVPLFPAPHLRAAGLTSSEAVALWQVNARSANMVRAAGEAGPWAWFERRASFFLEVATSLDPTYESLLRNPPHYGPGGEA